MIPEEAKQTFSNPRRQLASNARESKEVTFSSKHMLPARDTKIMVTKVTNISLMFNMNHGGDQMLLMGSTTIHPGFHEDGVP